MSPSYLSIFPTQKRRDPAGKLRTRVWFEASLVLSGYSNVKDLEAFVNPESVYDDSTGGKSSKCQFGKWRRGTHTPNVRSVALLGAYVPGSLPIWNHPIWETLRQDSWQSWPMEEMDTAVPIGSLRHRCRTAQAKRLRMLLKSLLRPPSLPHALDCLHELLQALSAAKALRNGVAAGLACGGFKAGLLALGLDRRWRPAARLFWEHSRIYLVPSDQAFPAMIEPKVFDALAELAVAMPRDQALGSLTGIARFSELLMQEATVEALYEVESFRATRRATGASRKGPG